MAGAGEILGVTVNIGKEQYTNGAEGRGAPGD